MADYTADGFITVTDGGTPQSSTVAPPYTQSPNFNSTTTWVGGGYDPDAVAGGWDPNNPSYGNPSNSIGGDVAVSQNFAGAPSFAGGYYGDQTEPTGGGYDPTQAGLSDPTNARLAAAGLNEGGSTGDPAVDPSVAFQTTSGPDGTATALEDDWRVRISLADRSTILYKEPLSTGAVMKPLIDTNGVVFPYTPSITLTHTANYQPLSPTHSNYALQFYNNSEVNDITITGDFTVQSVSEGRYLMAVIYFFRSATKMFFGSGNNAGNPPPVVFLDGYGQHYFPHVPCVVSSFSHTLSQEVDYIEIPITTSTLQDVDVLADDVNIGSVQLSDEEQKYVPSILRSAPVQQNPGQTLKRTQFQQLTSKVRLPTSSQISVTLKPVYSRKGLHDRFDLNKFAQGILLQDKDKGYGGFL